MLIDVYVLKIHINKTLIKRQNCCHVHTAKVTFMNHGASESCFFVVTFYVTIN